jgi:hypothetical protein
VQAETEQRAHKVSFYVKKDKAKQVTEALSKILEQRGVSYNALIFTSLLRNDFVCMLDFLTSYFECKILYVVS